MNEMWNTLMRGQELPPSEAFAQQVSTPQQIRPEMQFRAENQDFGVRPEISGSMFLPAPGGQIGVEGRYFQPFENAPADWQALMRYKRQF